MIDRYNRERVVLETDEGTAKDFMHLLEVWQVRCQQNFKHYKVISASIRYGAGRRRS